MDTLVVNEIYLSLQGESTFAGLPCIFVRLTACNLRCAYCDTAYAFTDGRRRHVDDVLAEVRRRAEPYRRGNPKSEIRNPKEVRSAKSEGSPKSEVRSPKSEVRSPNPAPAGSRGLPLVELTGGEPLLQPAALPLMRRLCDESFMVLLETSGALDIGPVDARVRRIMDLKCPSSGEVERNRWENLAHLRATDELKFVIGTVEDYAWAKQTIATHGLDAVCPLLLSWVSPLALPQQHPSLKLVPPGMTPLTRRELAERIIADALPVRFQVQMHKFVWPPDQRAV